MEEEHDDQQPEQEEEEDQHQVLHTDGVHALPDWLHGGGEGEALGLYVGQVVRSAQQASHHHLVGGEGLEVGQEGGGQQRVQYLMLAGLK